MNQRVERLRTKIFVDKYPLCTEKIRLLTESYQKTEGEPLIIRKAKALAHYLDNKTIYDFLALQNNYFQIAIGGKCSCCA
jgi:pyruvate-formate lyase